MGEGVTELDGEVVVDTGKLVTEGRLITNAGFSGDMMGADILQEREERNFLHEKKEMCKYKYKASVPIPNDVGE